MVSRELYPFTSRYLEVAGGKLHYVDEGQGDPVVFVHGNPTWSFFFRDLIRDLRRDHRAIAIDHIGCGFSDHPNEAYYSYSLESRIDNLETLIHHLGLTGNITLILHDWGGMIGMGWASRHPQQVRRLVLLNTAAFRLPANKKIPWQIGIVRNTPLGSFLVQRLNAFSLGLVHTCVVKRLSREVRAGYLAPYRSYMDRLAVLRFVQDIPLKPGDPSYSLVRSIEEGLGRFRSIPVLIAWGRRDFVFDDSFLAEWQKHLPQAEVHVFEDAAHLVLEDAGDRIVPLVRDFLARHPVDRP